jgi:hypothetical protein
VECNLHITTKEGEKSKKPPTTTQLSEVDKALAELKMKKAAMDKKEKHKAVVVNKWWNTHFPISSSHRRFRATAELAIPQSI